MTLADHDAAFGKLCPVHGEHQAVYCGAGMNLFREQRLEKEALLAEVRAAITELRDVREQHEDRVDRLESKVNLLMREGGPGRGHTGPQ